MKLLLLVHSEADVSHLEAAARAVLNSAITGVWVVFSPSITVDVSAAASKLDAEIAQLRSTERAAADRSDYEAAAGYKVQREGKELDKQKALMDAWKTAPEEDRKARVQAIFRPFLGLLQPAGKNVRITGHSDHYERTQWVQMLNSLTGVWFKEFTPGQFVIGWPESVQKTFLNLEGYAPVAPPPAHPAPTAAQKAEYEEKSRLPQVPKVTMSRAEELAGMKHFAFIGVAKKLGIDPAGKEKGVILAEILAAEQKPAEPALAEY